MSTNYYFKVVDAINVTIKGDESELKTDLVNTVKDNLDITSYIHIGQRAVGWKPLFQKTKYYSSVKEIKDFYKKNKDNIIITNEYEDILSFIDLDIQLFKWNKENVKAKEEECDGYVRFYKDEEGFNFCIPDFSKRINEVI